MVGTSLSYSMVSNSFFFSFQAGSTEALTALSNCLSLNVFNSSRSPMSPVALQDSLACCSKVFLCLPFVLLTASRYWSSLLASPCNVGPIVVSKVLFVFVL